MNKLERIKIVLEKGYTINNKGEVFNSKGRKRKLRLHKGSEGRTNYYSFNVKINNISYPIRTYYLQAYRKFGEEAFSENIQIRHLDSNSLNNEYSNIGIGSASDNMMDVPKQIRDKRTDKGWKEANPREKIEREYIYDLLYKGISYKEIRKNYNVALGTLSYMKNKSKEYQEYIKSKPVC